MPVPDLAHVAHDDLRSYALRRCIRFYTGVLLAFLAAWGIQAMEDHASADELGLLAAILFGTLAGVEAASGIVLAQLVRARGPGPETGMWRVAMGPMGSWVATALFSGVAGAFLLAATVW